MSGGITFGAAKAILSRVVQNGICDDDARVMTSTNEATKLLLDRILPVNGCVTYDIVASGNTLLLPADMENALDWEVLTGDVRGQADVREGGYELVNPFTYVSPEVSQDNPLIDRFLVPDADPTVLRRKYEYPGLSSGATVRVTGAKRYRPITGDNDYLIIQNLLALKLAILGVEHIENGKIEEGMALIGSKENPNSAVGLLHEEVKKHLSDPMQVMRRKAAYDADLANYNVGTYAYTRALLAHMLPNGLSMGKSSLSRLLDAAEMRIISKGTYVGTLEAFDAAVVDGRIAFPARVGSVIAAEVCGHPIDIRSMLFEYHTNGPGRYDCDCARLLVDQGDERFSDTGEVRRVYKLRGTIGYETARTMTFVAKLRWVKKAPADAMVIRNTEALRLMANAVLMEEAQQLDAATNMQALALAEMECELREHLAGIKQVLQVVTNDEGTYGYGGGL